MRRIMKYVFDKENNGDYDRLDKVLAEMQCKDNIEEVKSAAD